MHKRFYEIEGWRGLLAWWVILSHTLSVAGFKKKEAVATLRELKSNTSGILDLPQIIFYELLKYAHSGKLPVYIFIMVSGFVITHLLLNSKENYFRYIARRFLRLYPAFAFVLLIFAFFQLVGLPIKEIPRFWTYFFTEATLLHGLVPNEVLPKASTRVGGPGWSISLEWQFYIIAPFLLNALLRPTWLKTGALSVILLILIQIGFLHNKGFSFLGQRYTFEQPSALPHMIGYFIIGMLTYGALKSMPQLNLSKGPVLLVMLSLGFLASGFVGPEGPGFVLSMWAILLITIVNHENAVSTFLRLPFLQYLGKVSYSVYITHMIALYILSNFILSVNPDTSSFALFWLLFVVGWPMIFLLGALTFKFVETPFIEYGKRLPTKNKSEPLIKPDRR